MPLINVKALEGVFDDNQKQQIITALTDALVEIGGEQIRPVTWCIVDEVETRHWGIAGKSITADEVKHS